MQIPADRTAKRLDTKAPRKPVDVPADRTAQRR